MSSPFMVANCPLVTRETVPPFSEAEVTKPPTDLCPQQKSCFNPAPKMLLGVQTAVTMNCIRPLGCHPIGLYLHAAQMHAVACEKEQPDGYFILPPWLALFSFLPSDRCPVFVFARTCYPFFNGLIVKAN
jgi:hypothetical protein